MKHLGGSDVEFDDVVKFDNKRCRITAINGIILRLVAVTTYQQLVTKVTATTPSETGITKPTSGRMSVEQYLKKI